MFLSFAALHGRVVTPLACLLKTFFLVYLPFVIVLLSTEALNLYVVKSVICFVISLTAFILQKSFHSQKD